ncbi:hypothetical protein EIP91_005111 [Steccherinum ochraceum]|uniref:TauD/TfdA-like domain-containing protein n=1 Tax=Steccherinum ochraceum TaxID=92696 RepID=A0A4V2MVS8_9APHY|nr:hypothetical protein EIP91_005111 [Steccherinum ochraceum]
MLSVFKSAKCGRIPSLRMYSTTRPTSPSQTPRALHYDGVAYPYRWLRDTCQCPECIHPSTRQKLHRTSDVAADTYPASRGIEVTDNGVGIEWASGHRSFYSADLLTNHASSSSLQRFHQDIKPVPWTADKAWASKTLYVPYTDMQSPPGMLSAIEQLTKYGLLFITGVPTAKTDDKDCEVRSLAKMFGQIHNTFYGEVWDVKNIQNSTNIAYTNLDLGYHIDLTYFQHPPRYQFLHCLRNRVKGGMSLFVDALRAAQELRATNPSDFNLLTTTPVTFHYINDGHHLHHSHPTIELAPVSVSDDPTEPLPIRHINYSPPFQAPLPLSTPPEFYSAFERFARLLNRDEMRFEYTLKEGDAVVFDNRRVLHARTAFYDEKEEEHGEGEVNRWLKGCYVEADGVLDRGRSLRSALTSA